MERRSRVRLDRSLGLRGRNSLPKMDSHLGDFRTACRGISGWGQNFPERYTMRPSYCAMR
jgi:hypothetical protein